MSYEIGEVISKEEGYVNVRLPKKASCDHCHGCSLGIDKYMVTQASDTLGAEIGQKVKLEITELSAIKYGFILYIMPLLLFLGAYSLVEWFTKKIGLTAESIQAFSLLSGLFFLALPIAGLALINRHKKKKQEWSIRVVEIEPAGETSGACPEV